MFQTAALGVLALMIGSILNNRVYFLRHICIPSPVTGGIIVSFISLLLHLLLHIDFEFDGTLKDACMIMFFTTAGLQCNFFILKRGGKTLIILVLLVAVLIILQDLVGVGMSRVLGENRLLGMAAGSITMCGGHGTAAGFSDLLESKGLDGAASIAMAAATFGLLAGSLIGGPLGNQLVTKFALSPESTDNESVLKSGPVADNQAENRLKAVGIVVVVAGLGSLVTRWLSGFDISFPVYFGALLVAIVVRNCSELFSKCPKIDMDGIVSVGNIMLALFLGMAMVTLRLWELAEIALPLLVILACQVVLILLFARFVAFPLMGRTYDAALLVGGLCGFGLGATPNALANMNAISKKYGWSAMPFIIVPIVGAAFVDIINITVITIFLNQ